MRCCSISPFPRFLFLISHFLFLLLEWPVSLYAARAAVWHANRASAYSVTLSWKKSTRKLLNYNTYLSLLEDCVDFHIGACSIPIGRPARHWSVTLGDVKATRSTNFRIRLLTGCDGLEQDASRFRYRTQSRPSGDPTCKLCGSGPENAEHFILNCQSLELARRLALESAPPQVCLHIPDPTRDPVGFLDIILGLDWKIIDLLNFLSQTSIPTQGCQGSPTAITAIGYYWHPIGLLSATGGNKEEEEGNHVSFCPQSRWTNPFVN